MKVNMRIMKDGVQLYAGSYDVSDAESFGAACSDAWSKLRQEQFDRETSIGALMEHLDGDVLELLSGAQIRLERE